MAVFKRQSDGSLVLESVTKCCENCGDPSPSVTAATPAPVVPDTQPEPPETSGIVAPDKNEVEDDASSN